MDSSAAAVGTGWRGSRLLTRSLVALAAACCTWHRRTSSRPTSRHALITSTLGSRSRWSGLGYLTLTLTLALALTLTLILTLTLTSPNPNHLGVAPQVAAHVVVLRRHLA